MDSLEEHLAQLKVLNKKTLSPKPNNSGSCIYDSFNDELTREKNCKKIGPAVPPKPMKDMPQVPQSCIVRKTCEPLYSKRLVVNMGKTQEEINQSYAVDFELSSHSNFETNSNFNSNPNKNLFNKNQNTQNSANNVNDPRIKKLPILLRKQPPYEQQHHIYANIKMTLDNPAILDQQLEALEHHKKQLEKKGLLASVNKLSTNGPKLSSASYVNGELVAAARSSPSVKMMAAAITENQQKQQSFEKNLKSPMSTNKPLSNLPTNNKGFENTNSLGYPKKLNLDSLPTEQDIVYSNILHSPNLNKYNFLGEKNMYTNIQFNAENLPPPGNNNSQNSLLSLRQSETGTCLDYYNTQHQNSIEEDFPLPPSPVSSSYSELRRATDNCPQVSSYPSTVYHNDLDSITQSKQNPFSNASYNDYSTYGEPSTQSFSQSSSASDYYGFGSTCQGSSTYESIYEPITINPTNQLVSRSNFSLYTSYENETNIGNENVSHNAMDKVNMTNNPNNLKKDVEVQKFTDLIVNSIDSGNDIDSYGSCVKCGESIVGENSGCTAMDQIYHISCFTCTQCQINLQGKPFYALENKPYCEEDYLNTLEKCSVCMKPILERILRATGKPYHPQCFTCVVCGNSLDGIPFTVDATNQNYCIQDFHKKFAPRCCVCREPIMPDPGQEETVRVVALDRSFHFECYKCEDCGLLLSSEAEGRGCYPLDDHVLCKSCNAKRVQVLTNKMATEL